MATKEPDRPNPNPELKMTPSQTKLMEQCRAEAYEVRVANAESIRENDHDLDSWTEAYAQALYSERSKWLTPELPPRPPQGIGEQPPRYGLKWNGPEQPLSVPMNDGYWTPFHIAEASINALVQAVHDERSKRPTVEQAEKEIAAGSHRAIDSGDGYEWLVINVQELRSRLTKLFGGG